MHISPHYLVASNSFPTHFQHSWVECSFHGSFFIAFFFSLVGEESATSEETNSSLVADISLSRP